MLGQIESSRARPELHFLVLRQVARNGTEDTFLVYFDQQATLFVLSMSPSIVFPTRAHIHTLRHEFGTILKNLGIVRIYVDLLRITQRKIPPKDTSMNNNDKPQDTQPSSPPEPPTESEPSEPLPARVEERSLPSDDVREIEKE